MKRTARNGHQCTHIRSLIPSAPRSKRQGGGLVIIQYRRTKEVLKLEFIRGRLNFHSWFEWKMCRRERKELGQGHTFLLFN